MTTHIIVLELFTNFDTFQYLSVHNLSTIPFKDVPDRIIYHNHVGDGSKAIRILRLTMAA